MADICDSCAFEDDSTDRDRSEIGNRKGHQNYPSPRAPLDGAGGGEGEGYQDVILRGRKH